VASRGGRAPFGTSAGETGVVRDKCDCEGVRRGAIGLTLRVDNSQANRVDNFRESVPVLVLLWRAS
jgi:hypothetical protein